jgi:gliding motility-associated-like protein
MAFSAIIENVQTFTMKLRNGGSSTSFFVNGNNFDYIPTANCTKSDQYATDENTPFTVPSIGVLANDVDKDGDAISISRVQGTFNVGDTITTFLGAKAVMLPNGSFWYNPLTSTILDNLTNGQSRVDSFYYQITDGFGGYDLGTVTIAVTGITDPPPAQKTFSSSPVCRSATTATVVVTASEGGVTYQAYDNALATLLGTTVGDGTNKSFTINVSTLPLGYNRIRFRAIRGAQNVLMTDSATVRIDALTVGGNVNTSTTVCSTSNSGSLTLTGHTGSVVRWESSLDNFATAATNIANTTISQAYLNLADTTQYRAVLKSGECPAANSGIATITVNPNPGGTVPVFSDPVVCANATSVTINASNLVNGVKYVFSHATLGKIDSLTATSSTGVLTIPLSKFSPVANQVTVRTLDVVGSIAGCNNVTFGDKSVVTINPLLNPAYPTFSDPVVCANATNATITISNAIVGVKYVFSLGLGKLDSVVATSTTQPINIALSKLNPVANLQVIRTLDVTGSISQCNAVTFTDKSVVTINPILDPTYPTFSDPTVCSNDLNATVTISNAIVGVKYVFSHTILGKLDSVVATSTTQPITILLSKFAPVANQVTVRTLDVTGSISSCNTVIFSDKSVVTINPILTPGLPTFSDPIVCSNDANATITISNAIVGVKYVFSHTTLGKLDSVTAISTSQSISIALSKFNPTSGVTTVRTLDVTGSIAGCNTVTFTDKAVVTINSLPIITQVVTGDTICSYSGNPNITIANAEANVTYTARLNSAAGTVVGTGSRTTAGLLSVAITKALLASSGNNTIYVVASIAGCGNQTLSDTANIRINNPPLTNPAVTATGPVCQGGTSTVTINPSEIGVRYIILDNGDSVDNVMGTGASVSKGVVLALAGNRTISIQAEIPGCTTVTLANTASVLVNTTPGTNLLVSATSPVCQNGQTTVTVFATNNTVKYLIYDGVLRDSLIGNGGNVSKAVTLPDTGNRVISFKAVIAGCNTAVDLANTANVRVNALPSGASVFSAVSPVCQGNTSLASITGTLKGAKYVIFEDLDRIDSLIGNGGLASKAILLPDTGNHVLRIQASIGGCAIVPIADTAFVRVNGSPSTSSSVDATNPVCIGGNTTLTINPTTKDAWYLIFENSILTDSVKGTGGSVSKAVRLDTAGNRILSVQAKIGGCTIVNLTDQATVLVNDPVDTTLTSQGDTVCSNSPTATVLVFGTKANERYQAYEGMVAKGASVLSTGGTVTLTLPLGTAINQLNPSVVNHTISIGGTSGGCSESLLDATSLVLINQLPDTNLAISATGPVCLGENTTITVTNSTSGVTYSLVYEDSVIQSRRSTGGNLSFVVATTKLGLQTYSILADIAGCATFKMKNVATVQVNSGSGINLQVDEVSPICFGDSTIITIRGTDAISTYHIWNLAGDSVVTGKRGNGGNLSFGVHGLTPGLNKLVASAFTPGCGIAYFTDTARVVVNPLPDSTLTVKGDTVCSDASNATVTIFGTKTGERYTLFENDVQVGNPVTSTGGDLAINLTGLSEGLHKIVAKADIGGCKTVTLKDTADVLINILPNPDLDVVGDTICSNSDSAYVRILGTKLLEKYVAYLNTDRISDTVLSQGGEVVLKIARSSLNLDTNLVEVRSFIEGCGVFTLNERAIVIVNRLPDSTLAVRGDTVCSSESAATVTIVNAAKSVVYTAYIGTQQVGNSVVGNGGDAIISIPVTQLAPDTNIVSIRASIDGCAIVPLVNKARVILNQKPNVTLDLLGSTVCSTADTATLTVVGSNLNARYKAIMGSGVISEEFVGTGGDIVLKVAVSKLQIGTNQVGVNVGISGCDNSDMDKTAALVVNKLPDPKLATDGSVVCESDGSATVTVDGSVTGVTYQAFLGTDGVSNQAGGNGGQITLSVPVTELVIGQTNRLVVVATISQCADVPLDDTALVVVNKQPLVSNTIEGSSVCPSSNGVVTISATEANVTYDLFVNGTSSGISVLGDGSDKTLSVSSTLLANTINPVKVTASIQSCRTVDILDADTVFVLNYDDDDFGLKGDNLSCFYREKMYSVNMLPGVISYNWSLSNNTAAITYTSFKTDSIRVKFDTISTTINVVPVGTFGECSGFGASRLVDVTRPLLGSGTIVSLDTVCRYDIDTVYVKDISGASFYTWKWHSDVEVIDSIDTDTGMFRDIRRYVVKYHEAGFRPLSVSAYSFCEGGYGDTTVKQVRILGIPVAEANEYEVYPMESSLTAIPLNGNGSTLAGDTLRYRWFEAGRTGATFTNAGSLNGASVTPNAGDTKVYLEVSHKGGYCTVKDSALISIRFFKHIPNVFTPNGDGVHDTWVLKNVNLFYPSVEVEVFNKWGNRVWKSQAGYPEPWDGSRNGDDLPMATYYYIIDLKDGNKPLTGSVSIIK